MTGKLRSIARGAMQSKKQFDGFQAELREEIKSLPRSVKQKEIAEALKISESTVSLFLAGIRPLPDGAFKRAANWRAQG